MVVAAAANEEMVAQRLRNEVEYALDREVLRGEGLRARKQAKWSNALKYALIT